MEALIRLDEPKVLVQALAHHEAAMKILLGLEIHLEQGNLANIVTIIFIIITIICIIILIAAISTIQCHTSDNYHHHEGCL